MPDRLRIALISYYLPSTSKIGVGYAVHDLAEELIRRGHDVDVFSDCPPVPGARYGHRHLAMRGSLRTFRFALAMRRVDLSGYDVLHAAGEDYWLWRRRVPAHVRTLHGSCFAEALHIRGAAGRARMLLLGCTEVLASVVADRTTVISPATRRWTPWVRTVVPIGIDLHRFTPEPAERATRPVVLFVGTWGGRKRGELLAREFVAGVLPRVPAAELWLVSRDVPPGRHPALRVLGAVDDATLRSLYRQAWVCCLPSSYEGFGIPYAEAMASGTPVVATPNGGARYVLDGGRAGIIAKPGDLGAALVRLLTDAAERDRLRAAGRARVEAFGLERVADEYERIYRALVTRNSHRIRR